MLKILKKKNYRVQFIIYSGSLFLVCLFVCLVLTQNVVRKQIDSFHDNAQESFRNVESMISANINRIDSYFLDLYSSRNKAVLDDYMRLFGNDAQTYVTRRLEELSATDVDNDCVADITQFVNTTRNAISEVALTLLNKPNESNIIHFKTPTFPTVEFKVNRQSDQKNTDGYIYTKLVMDPRNMSEELGKMEFFIDRDVLYNSVSSNEIDNSAFVGANIEIFPKNISNKQTDYFRAIYEKGDNNGTIGNSFTDRKHYIVFTSEQNQYRFIATLPEVELVKTNAPFYVIIFGGMLFIYGFCSILILFRMSYDYKNIQAIVKVIDQTKVGNFTTIDSSKMKDEYKIIAQELNDMAKQLDLYIKEKYIIKLKQEKAERKMLQQQISPHFLYNTLEIIRSRALVEGSENIANVVCNLGTLFRSIVKGEDIITIEEELDLLQKYISIMEFKYPDKFFYQIDIPRKIREMKTVKFWIQPIVENYFIHGFNLSSEFNLLIARATSVENGVLFEFINNGLPIEQSKLGILNENLTSYEPESYDGKIGLRNVYTRLSYFYGDSLTMQVVNNDKAGVSIQIFMPEI